jgi:DNA-binding MarR family transcriptional regulator
MFDPFTKPGFLIRRLQQISVRIFQEATAAFDVSTVQYGALQVIEHQPGIDQVTLAQATDTDRTTIVRVVDRLSEAGLISKQSNPDDRRSNRLRITAAGARLVRDVYEHAEASQQRLLSPLAPADRADFLRHLWVLVTTHAGQGLAATGPAAGRRAVAASTAARPRRSARPRPGTVAVKYAGPRREAVE